MEIDLSVAIQSLREMAESFIARLPQVALALVIFTAIYFIAKLIRSTIRKLAQRHAQHENLGLVLGRLAQVVIVGIGFFIAITIIVPSVKANSLVQLLGISSIAIGFAFKDILQNFLAGILILINQPFHLRDQIKVGEFEGTVEDIQTRATFIRTYDGRRIVIPNAKVFTEAVTVNTAFKYRRSEVVVGIGYGDDAVEAKKIIIDAIKSVEGVAADPAPDTITTELAPSTLDIRARWWSEPDMASVLNVQDRVVAKIKSELTKAGIDIPFPTQQILFHDQTEETDGNRRKQREGWPAGDSEVPESRKTADSIIEASRSLDN